MFNRICVQVKVSESSRRFRSITWQIYYPAYDKTRRISCLWPSEHDIYLWSGHMHPLSMWWHQTHIWNQTHIFSPNDTRHIPYYMRIRPDVLLKRTRLLKHKFFEKVSQTLRYDFLDFFVHISKIARFLGENISSPTLLKVTSVLIQSDPTFLHVS